MRFLMRLRIPNEAGNAMVRDREFGQKFQSALQEVRAETAYLTTVDGQRGGYVVVNVDDASRIPSVAEPFFQWLKADVEFIPVMLPDDLAKAGPAISAAVQKWG